MIDFDLVMLVMGVLGAVLALAWIVSPRLRAHVEHPKHTMLESAVRGDDEDRAGRAP